MVTQEQATKAKLKALSQGVKVWALESGRRYAVPSSTSDGSAYEVVIESQQPGDITCTCRSGINRGVCKHIGAVLVRLQVEQELLQTPQHEALDAKIAELYS